MRTEADLTFNRHSVNRRLRATHHFRDISGRVALGSCPPRAPTDPDVLALEHPVPRAMGSLPDGRVNAVPYPELEKFSRFASSAIRCCFVDTLIESLGIRCRSQQRFHVPVHSLPFTGSPRAQVPPLQRYYQGTATPVSLPAALRFLRLAVPREHACFAPVALACRRDGPGVVHPVSPAGMLPWS